jgi:hypothetical protein
MAPELWWENTKCNETPAQWLFLMLAAQSQNTAKSGLQRNDLHQICTGF